MATFKRLASKRWQAQVARKGIRRAKTFKTKQEAKDWAARQEFLISNGDDGALSGTLGDLFDRYAREVSPRKRGARWEIIRFELLKRDPIADVNLRELAPSHFADWRDRRLKDISPASVAREMNLMSGALTVARKEWGWLKTNPISEVRKPSKPPPRDRRVSADEIASLMEKAGSDMRRISCRVVHAFRFAIETAMRAGEIVNMDWDDVDLEGRVVHLPKTKNGYPRYVPLSRSAIDLLEELPGREGTCFKLGSEQLSAMFRKVRLAAKIENLTFHDSRHEAITRLAKKLDVLSLARMVGHRDIRMLQIYYNETAEEMAKLLD